MTVGERLQVYRKQKNLSQEALAKELLVTRQTVSLWENDQTLPTVENLIRLQEILGVSIDDILTEPKTQAAQSPTPTETYAFQYTRENFRTVEKILNKVPFKKLIINIVNIIFILFCIYFMIDTSAPDELIGAFIGALCIIVISLIKSLVIARKQKKSTLQKLLPNTYFYEVFADCLKVTITKAKRIQSQHFIYREDIQKYWVTNDLLIFDCNGQLYCLTKTDILDSAQIFAFFRATNKEEQVPSNSVLRLQRAANLFFILSLILLPLTAFLLNAEESSGTFALPNMWKLYFLLPVPIISVMLGALLIRKGERGLKNIVIGVIVACLLLLYGSFSFIFADTYNTNPEEILEQVEQTIQMDLPSCHGVITYSSFEESKNSPFGYINSIHFVDDEVIDFETTLLTDTRWKTEMSSVYIGLLPTSKSTFAEDYFVLYNIDTQQYNTYPKADGTYKFIYLTYDTEKNVMDIILYTKEIILSAPSEST